MTESGRVVVAGAGLAGFRTAEELRERGRALYQQDLRNRVSRLYARLDEQNARLDAILAERTERGGE